jgi:hypothetical protein
MKKSTKKDTLVTYKIVSDMDGRLKTAGRTACNFWNAFIKPSTDVVIRLGTFTDPDPNSGTIAQAWTPYSRKGVLYGRVEFNTKYLRKFSANQIAGTVVHELGHTLGMGWNRWMKLFNESDGAFFPKAVKACPALGAMSVELDGGSGTELCHWDEDTFGAELMTGYKDGVEHVLPVTVEIMEMLGHSIKKKLPAKTGLTSLLRKCSQVVFSERMKVGARQIDRDHFVDTEPFETIPHVPMPTGA